MLIEALAAGVVGAVLLWLVLQPIVAPDAAPPADTDPPDPEETPQGIALLALKEIEFDHATGKLSEADFAILSARYTAAAVALLEPNVAGAYCLRHGARGEAAAQFCSECGAGLVRSDGACLVCGFVVQSDAMFCPGCGVPVRK
jgi:hypothetical protein